MVAGLEITYGRTYRLDNAHPFMAKRSARRYRRDIALENVQVSATYRRVQQANNGVSRFIDERGRFVSPDFNARALIDEGFHNVFLYPMVHQYGTHVLDRWPSSRR